MTSPAGRGPGVDFPPPFFFVAGFVVGWAIDRYVYHIATATNPTLARAMQALGSALILAGVALAVWGIATFGRLKTAVFPNRDASQLVVAGPYKFTRNPMYSGMTIAYLGLSIMFQFVWPLLVLPLVLLAVYRFVIAREERYLTAAFGDAYRQYQQQVGRWW